MYSCYKEYDTIIIYPKEPETAEVGNPSELLSSSKSGILSSPQRDQKVVHFPFFWTTVFKY